MRESHKASIIEHEGGNIGIFSGADFCAEHEQGIEKLMQTLGCKNADLTSPECKTFGVGNHIADSHSYAMNSVFRENKSSALLVIGQDASFLYGRLESKAKSWPIRPPIPEDENGVSCAWDSGSIAVAVGKKNIRFLVSLHEAFLEGHGFVGTSRQLPVFDNGGVILVKSKHIPAEHATKLEDAERDVFNRHQLAQSTGIFQRLAAHNAKVGNSTRHWNDTSYIVLDDGTVINKENYDPACQWFALSPRWAPGAKVKDLSTLAFWLNPMNQDQNTACWCTVKDLDDWIAGTGLIPGKGYGRQKYVRTLSVASGHVEELFGDEIYCHQCKEIVNVGRERNRGSKCPKCGCENVLKAKG